MVIGIYIVGEYIGFVFFSLVLFVLMGVFGWCLLFWVVGVVGIVFGLVWWKFYYELCNYLGVNLVELVYIEVGGGFVYGVCKDGDKSGKLV